MKKDYLQPKINVEVFSVQEVILGSVIVEDDFSDGYNVLDR